MRIVTREEKRLKNKIFQSRDLCLRALDTNSSCAENVRRNGYKIELDKEESLFVAAAFIRSALYDLRG